MPPAVEIDRKTAQLRAREIGEEHMRRAGRSELSDADKTVASLAFRRLLLIVPEHLGGWEGKSERWLVKAGIEISDISDGLWNKITFDQPLPADFVWPQRKATASEFVLERFERLKKRIEHI